jgi:hypothetical protein
VLTSTLIAVGCKPNVGSVVAQPTFDFVDTGLLDNDGITNNGLITLKTILLIFIEVTMPMIATVPLKVNGTGSSFTLADNATYAANAIQVRQTDAVGNVSALSCAVACIVL